MFFRAEGTYLCHRSAGWVRAEAVCHLLAKPPRSCGPAGGYLLLQKKKKQYKGKPKIAWSWAQPINHWKLNFAYCWSMNKVWTYPKKSFEYDQTAAITKNLQERITPVLFKTVVLELSTGTEILTLSQCLFYKHLFDSFSLQLKVLINKIQWKITNGIFSLKHKA